MNATKRWKVTKIHRCEYTGHEVVFETEPVYPADLLPDPPLVVAHCCSDSKDFNMVDELNYAYTTNLDHPGCLIFNIETIRR